MPKPRRKGLAIIVEADKKDTGWGDATADMTMTLKTSKDKKATDQSESECWKF